MSSQKVLVSLCLPLNDSLDNTKLCEQTKELPKGTSSLAQGMCYSFKVRVNNWISKAYKIINRPGVAGAVLHTPS